ncbi:MAG: hypothetical protein QXM96_00315 [Candidatus Woesearchaeota archaeon]
MNNKKIYSKKGRLNYKEKKIIDKIKEYIENKNIDIDNITPAKNFDELKKMYYNIVGEDVDFIILDDNNDKPKINFETNSETESNESKIEIDPFNEAEPIVRDYVTESKGSEKIKEQIKKENKTNFEEPPTIDSQFSFPDDKNEISNDIKNIADNLPEGFSKIEIAKLRKFSFVIVTVTCNLIERGFVWYAVSDIQEITENEELYPDINLEVIISLDEKHEQTLRDFFKKQKDDAKKLLAISKEERDLLIESLLEYLIEKKVKIKSHHSILVIFFNILLEKFIIANSIKNMNQIILNKIKLISEKNKQNLEQKEVQEETQVQEENKQDKNE